MNLTNYIVTSEGIISKLDTYWDKLRRITVELETLSKNTARKLFSFYGGVFFALLPVLLLKPSRTVGVLILTFMVVSAVCFVAIQLANFLEFNTLRKQGNLLARELSREIEVEYMHEDEAPFEERIILSSFQLATHLPINQYLYLLLLCLLPLITGAFLWGFYLQLL
jgi:heme/copper-type cytochrome/quinol oxidase subunit 4